MEALYDDGSGSFRVLWCAGVSVDQVSSVCCRSSLGILEPGSTPWTFGHLKSLLKSFCGLVEHIGLLGKAAATEKG